MMTFMFRLAILAYSLIALLSLNDIIAGRGSLLSAVFTTAFSAGSVAATNTNTNKIIRRNNFQQLHQTTNKVAQDNNDNKDSSSSLDNSPPHDIEKQLPERVSVAIIGGGLGGLAVCAALQYQGVDAHVFEAAPKLLRGSTGTGIMISKNGFDALDAIDPQLPMKMREVGSNIERQTVYMSDPIGAIQKEFSFNMSSTNEQVNIGWSRAQEILSSIIPESLVHCNARFESYEMTEDTDTSTITVSFEDGRSVQTSLVIGVDGIGSAVRKFMAHDNDNDNKNDIRQQEKAAASYKSVYNGQLLWNAIVPTCDIQPTLAAHAPGQVEFINCGIDGQCVLAFDAGEEQTSWYLTLMEKDIRRDNNNNDNVDSTTRYGEEMKAIRSALDDGTFGGFGREGVRDQLKKAFEPWPKALACLDATPESQIFERRLEDRPKLMDWTGNIKRNGGRVVLMGDAAHPMIPSQGQGTMMAWEDAADLASCVAPHILLLQQQQNQKLKEEDDVEQLEETRTTMTMLSKGIQSFVSQRSKRTARIQKMSSDSYMGRKWSNFFPKKIVRMLKMKRQFTFLKDGYQPPIKPTNDSDGNGNGNRELKR